ncbi:hypothetical protein ABW20_dc0102296 [Dactylellina cionopaga]|nr:hypothetical protein ABW20_dc0102296 [Dactylellina cionopaga]
MHFTLHSVITNILLVTSAATPCVLGHSIITSAQSSTNKVIGWGIGYEPFVFAVKPSGGNSGYPDFEDSPSTTNATTMSQRSMTLWSGCGGTATGVNNHKAVISAMARASTIPQVKAGGTLKIAVYQIDGDGGGPYVCGIDSTGTASAKTFRNLTITQQVPGNSPKKNTVSRQEFPLVVKLSSGLRCTGQYGDTTDICIIRCQNYATGGPYGNCLPIQLTT